MGTVIGLRLFFDVNADVGRHARFDARIGVIELGLDREDVELLGLGGSGRDLRHVRGETFAGQPIEGRGDALAKPNLGDVDLVEIDFDDEPGKVGDHEERAFFEGRLDAGDDHLAGLDFAPNGGARGGGDDARVAQAVLRLSQDDARGADVELHQLELAFGDVEIERGKQSLLGELALARHVALRVGDFGLRRIEQGALALDDPPEVARVENDERVSLFDRCRRL